MINPAKDKGSDLELYEFLGILMGVCVRTGATLNLDLPQQVWKRLVGQKLTLEDIYEVDLRFNKKMKQILGFGSESDFVN